MNAFSPALLVEGGTTTARSPIQVSAAIMEGASLTELVMFGRLFHAAINSRVCDDTREAEEKLGDDMEVLANFDDEISTIIAQRAPVSATEYAAKVGYFVARMRAGSMSDAVDELVLDALERDARAMAALPLATAEEASS